MKHPSIGFIGLGAMGAPMAGHLAKAGLLQGVWNRSINKAQALADEFDITVFDSPTILAKNCQIVLICVSADDDVRQMVDAIAPYLADDAIVVDHSTVAPDTAKYAADVLAKIGAHFLDAPISGGIEGAKNAALSIMVGGDTAVLERVKILFDCYAARVSHMGAVGNGQATKAVNQVLIGGIAETVCEGLALAEQLQLPTDALLQVLQNGAAGSWFLDKRGATMLEDNCDTGFKLELLIKDLRICQQIARNNNLTLAGVERALEDYLQCLQAGDGAQDISALIRLKRQQLATKDKAV